MKTVEKVWETGGSSVITIRKMIMDELKLEDGDFVEVEIKKAKR